MTDKKTSPTPAASDESDAESTPVDGHGHNPDDYDWVPVLRKRRKDGWTPERQRAFIGALADTGEVIAAARSVGMSDSSAYTLRRAPGAERFAAAWEAALGNSTGRLVDIAFDRAINGVDDVVLDKEGNHIYTKRKYNDRLLMFLIRAHGPARYSNPHGNGAAAGGGSSDRASATASRGSAEAVGAGTASRAGEAVVTRRTGGRARNCRHHGRKTTALAASGPDRR